MFPRGISCLSVVLVLAASAPAHAQAVSCHDYANKVVKENVEGILSSVLEQRPELKKLSQKELVKTAGEQLITADDAKLRVHGYMMLMWYGDEAARQKLAEHAGALKTEADRANFYFVMGLNLLRSKTPKMAVQGRDYIKQMKETGHVTFVNDVMWTNLIEDCELAK